MVFILKWQIDLAFSVCLNSCISVDSDYSAANSNLSSTTSLISSTFSSDTDPPCYKIYSELRADSDSANSA